MGNSVEDERTAHIAGSSASQADIERAWLDLTYDITRKPKSSCVCNPSSGAARWSGYLGPAYVDQTRPRRRFLFVGANHNPRGLEKTPAMASYNKSLCQWALRERDKRSDARLLDSMRRAYELSWPQWGAVWRIFAEIRSQIGIDDGAFAFVNLARCPYPDPARDDEAITACQISFPLENLVQAIEAQVIFLAKGGLVGRAVKIPGEASEERLVVRYGNGSYGSRPGAKHYTHWLPREAARVLAFVATGRSHEAISNCSVGTMESDRSRRGRIPRQLSY
jgi:hypothetical protein